MSTRKRARVKSDDAEDVRNEPDSSASQHAKFSDNAQEEQTQERQRDTEFWFEDGSVLLVAGGFEFKVYRAVLSARSLVFKDMFSLPQPPSSSGSNDLPVVPLSDSPEDLRHVLRACMPTESPNIFPPYNKPSFYAVSACIRLGHKYQMSSLFESAINHLKKSYPSELDDYLSARDKWGAGFWGLSAIHVVTLARLIGDDLLLPVALMECSSLGVRVMDGFKLEDGSIEHLSQVDFKRSLKATVPLVKANAWMCMDIFSAAEADNCFSPELCRDVLFENLECCHSYIDVAVCPDWDSRLEYLEDDTCPRCYSMIEARVRPAQVSIWKRLPHLLDIEVDGWAKETTENAH